MNKMQNRKNGLTIDQKIFIKNNYKTMSNKEIGTILNIDAEKIRRYASSLKLKKEQYLSIRSCFSFHKESKSA